MNQTSTNGAGTPVQHQGTLSAKQLAGGQASGPSPSKAEPGRATRQASKTVVSSLSSLTPTDSQLQNKAEQDLVSESVEERNDPDEDMEEDEEDEPDFDDDDSEQANDVIMMDQEVSLPRAPVKMIIMEKLPENTRIHTTSKELIINLALQFLNTLSARANDVCNQRNKKTVCGDHVIDALFEMNLGHYMAKIADPQMSAKREKTFLKQKPAKQKADVLARLQKESKMVAHRSKAAQQSDDELLTDEQRKQKQAELFEEARMMFNAQPKATTLGFNTSQQEEIEQDVAAMYEVDENGVPRLPYLSSQVFQDWIYQTDFLNDEPEPAMEPVYAQDFDQEMRHFSQSENNNQAVPGGEGLQLQEAPAVQEEQLQPVAMDAQELPAEGLPVFGEDGKELAGCQVDQAAPMEAAAAEEEKQFEFEMDEYGEDDCY